MVATITLLDSFGIPVVGFDRAQVDLIKVIEYMYKYNSNKSRQFFSTIKRESVGKEFHSRIELIQDNMSIIDVDNTSTQTNMIVSRKRDADSNSVLSVYTKETSPLKKMKFS